MPDMGRRNGRDERHGGARVTGPQIAAMTVLTLIDAGAGIIVATLFGRWAM
jgi:hypothetical protein